VSLIEVVDKIPEIDSITLEEKKDFYILTVSYTPRYGFGMIYQGSSSIPNDDGVWESFKTITISDIDAWENWKDGDEFKPKTEIQLRFPKQVYGMSLDREKETETYLFFKKNFFYNRKELVSIDYRS